MMVVQIGQHRHDRGAKRRTGRHGGGRNAAQPAPTAGAAPAKNLHPDSHRPERRQLDMIIGLAQRLATGADRRAAMRAPLGTTINHTIRIARAIPCHARSLAVPPWSLLLAWRSIALLSPRRRYARIPRCL